MTKAILYSFRRCPYAMRARFALITCDIDYEHREILLRDKPQQMLNISPKGTVPVMQLPDGTVLEESLDIMLWALNQAGNGLAQLPGAEKELITQHDTSFKEGLDLYKYPTRYEGDDAVLRQNGYEVCHAFLIQLEKLLEQNTSLFGDNLRAADIAIFPFVRQFSKVDADAWQQNNFPYLRVWLEGLCESETFEKVMQKYPLWQE